MFTVNTPAEAGNGLVQALPSDADWKKGEPPPRLLGVKQPLPGLVT